MGSDRDLLSRPVPMLIAMVVVLFIAIAPAALLTEGVDIFNIHSLSAIMAPMLGLLALLLGAEHEKDD